MFLNLLKLVFLIPILVPHYCGASPVGDDLKNNYSNEEMDLGNSSKPIEIINDENLELNSEALLPQQDEYLRQQRQSSYSEYGSPIQQDPQSLLQQQYLALQQSQYPQIQQSQYPQIQQSQYPQIQQSQYPQIQQSQYPQIQQSQYPQIQQSQYPQIQQYGYSGVSQEYPAQQQQPEWYTGLQQGYQSPQQSAYPSNPFPQSLTCLYSIYKAGGDLCGLRSYSQMCRYKNPCVLSPGKYLKVIGNSQYFVQCDNNASAYCKSCGPGTVWDQDLYTCNYPTATNY